MFTFMTTILALGLAHDSINLESTIHPAWNMVSGQKYVNYYKILLILEEEKLIFPDMIAPFSYKSLVFSFIAIIFHEIVLNPFLWHASSE